MESTPGYHQLPSSEKDSVGSEHPHLRLRQSKWSQSNSLRHILIALGMFVMLITGFLLGAAKDHLLRREQFAPHGNQHYYMHFNGSFPERKSTESDALWEALFPEHKGFFKHPTLAPNVGGFAVFHELHCLNMLRQAFFSAADGTLAQTGDASVDMNHRTSTHHIRHCFEYLRQSLICLADSNVENMNYTTRGVSGWQTERTCGNYDGLVAFSNQWGVDRHQALKDWDMLDEKSK